MMEMTPAEHKKKRMKRVEDSFRDLWDNIKHKKKYTKNTIIQKTHVPQGSLQHCSQ